MRSLSRSMCAFARSRIARWACTFCQCQGKGRGGRSHLAVVAALALQLLGRQVDYAAGGHGRGVAAVALALGAALRCRLRGRRRRRRLRRLRRARLPGGGGRRGVGLGRLDRAAGLPAGWSSAGGHWIEYGAGDLDRHERWGACVGRRATGFGLVRRGPGCDGWPMMCGEESVGRTG
jgi:hypothetical protein